MRKWFQCQKNVLLKVFSARQCYKFQPFSSQPWAIRNDRFPVTFPLANAKVPLFSLHQKGARLGYYQFLSDFRGDYQELPDAVIKNCRIIAMSQEGALSKFIGYDKDLQFVHSDEPSTIPCLPDERHEFTVTHPFHPLHGRSFPFLSRRNTWGAPRVQFVDQSTDQVCSLPVAWTNLGAAEPFVELAAGRALLRPADLLLLSTLLGRLAAEP
jgi:hypothetical protein